MTKKEQKKIIEDVSFFADYLIDMIIEDAFGKKGTKYCVYINKHLYCLTKEF